MLPQTAVLTPTSVIQPGDLGIKLPTGVRTR